MLVIITDLDGTLLDPRSYSYDEARPALELIREFDIPLVLCTSKTRTEVEYWRARLENRHPFIVENGGGLYIPRDYFPCEIHAPVDRDDYAVFEFGDPYPELVETLRAASSESGCEVIGFHQLSAAEISVRYDMTITEARLAKQREFDEPFEILGSACGPLLAAIERRGKRWLKGGRLYHIVGVNDKAHCVNLLTHFYRRLFNDVATVGIGDGPNDLGFLNAVDFPILVQSPATGRLKTVIKGARLTNAEGPEGWNQAVLSVVNGAEQAAGPRRLLCLARGREQIPEHHRAPLIAKGRK